MNAIVNATLSYFERKYKEPSTWVGIVIGIATAAHATLSPDLANAIAGACAAIVSALCVAINEHKPAAAIAPAVVVHPGPLQPADGGERVHQVQPINRADLPPDQRGNDSERPHPVRPGFGNT